MLIDDEQLAVAMQNGNQDALVQLVERYHSRLIGYVYRLTGGDRTLAEDLVQETFLRMMKAIKGYQQGRTFRPWLYTIATNLTLDHFKAADTQRTDNLPERDLPTTSRLDEHIVQAQEEQRVMATLMQLPEHQRAVVVLRYYEEMSLADIAQTLDIPLGTVKSRLSKGLEQLRRLMKESAS